jgi:hypothetical protein
MQLEGVRSIEKSSDHIVKRMHDLPAYSASTNYVTACPAATYV